MKKKRIRFLAGILLSVFLLSGCDYANVAILNSSSAVDGKIKRSSYYWSGTSRGTFTVDEDDPKEVIFDIDMEKGSITFTLEDSDGVEVYSLTEKDGYIGTSQYTVEKAGNYRLKQQGRKFSGSYKITWGDTAAEETAESVKEAAD